MSSEAIVSKTVSGIGLFKRVIALKRLNPLRRLLPFLMRYKMRLMLTIVFVTLSALSAFALPFNLGGVIDQGFATQDLGRIAGYAWIIAGFGVIGALASAGRIYFVSFIGERMVTDVRHAVFTHLLTLDTAFFNRHRMGDLTSRLNGDAATIRFAISSTAPMALRAIVTIVGAFVLMLLTSPYLTVAVVVAGPLMLLPMLVLARRLRKMSRRSQDAMADLSALANEMLGANRTVKSFTREDEEARRYQASGDASFGAEIQRVKMRALIVGLLMALSTMGMLFAVWWGAKAVFDGAATAGQLAQFMVYGVMAAGSLSSLSDIAGTLQTLAGSTERLVEILDTPAAIASPAAPLPMPRPSRGTLQFRDVGFRYTAEGASDVFTGLSFRAKKGKTTALVGSSGGGKSTVFSLVQRLYDVTEGSILVDGLDVRQVDLGELRRRIAVVEQEPTIFSGTIADNIRFGRIEASHDDIMAAAIAAHVDEFVSQLPDGYDTLVGERGVTLSGGQRQRLAIARAMLKDAPILLLDEATSALDAHSERTVQDAIARLRTGRTTLVIAHRLATIRDVDAILVFDKGKIVESGTHAELMAANGLYADLSRLQFRDKA